MTKRSMGAILALAMLTTGVLADSIDDAEAKQRGVPVSQVRAENALAAEKRKTADLEKQVAELKQQLAELQSKAPATTKAKP